MKMIFFYKKSTEAIYLIYILTWNANILWQILMISCKTDDQQRLVMETFNNEIVIKYDCYLDIVLIIVTIVQLQPSRILMMGT